MPQSTNSPVAASLAAGEQVRVEHIPGFVDGIGAPFLFPEMWAFVPQVLDGALVSSPEEMHRPSVSSPSGTAQ